MKKRTFLAGALVGGAVAGIAALLTAPQSGKKTRRQLQYRGEEAVEKVVESGERLCKKGKKTVLHASDFAKEKADEIVLKAKEVIKK